jgi:hypothetical protein
MPDCANLVITALSYPRCAFSLVLRKNEQSSNHYVILIVSWIIYSECSLNVSKEDE